MFGARFNHETRFFLASGGKGTDTIVHRELSGIESIDLSHSASASISKPLGTRKGITTSTGPVQQSLSLSRYLIYNDPILGLTGDMPSGVSGSIHYADRSYGFKSGHLTNYSVNCAVGSIPKVSTSFQVFGEMKSGQSASGTLTHPDIYIPSQGSISLTCSNGYDGDVSSTNRVVGFDYSVTSNRKPLFSLGRKNAAEVVFVPPLEYSASVQVDVDEAMLQSGFNFLTGRENNTLSFTINGRDGDSLQSLTVPKASLVGEQLNASADGALKLTLNYIGHS